MKYGHDNCEQQIVITVGDRMIKRNGYNRNKAKMGFGLLA